MRVSSALLSASFLAAAVVACSGSTVTSLNGANPEDDDASSGSKNRKDGGHGDDDDEDASGPHALGTIFLGEMHVSGQSEVTPLVSVGFVPDASKVKAACTEKLDGCEIQLVPTCATSAGDDACAFGEACTFDDACKARCTKLAKCDEPCGDDEVCTLKNAKTGEGVCTATRSFDAGPIAFSGTTTPITLYPPYDAGIQASGAPFLGDSEVRVKAQGAAEDGFEKFDDTFTTTSFIQPKPELGKLPRDVVFGKAALPISWVPGNDRVVVSVGGAAGTATCEVADKTGTTKISRKVIDRVRGKDAYASSNLSVSLARVRTETKKDKKVIGQGAEPQGWLMFTTSSTEMASFRGCAAGETACGDLCTDPSTDAQNCGACGKACSSGQTCDNGSCRSAPTCAPGPENTLTRCSDGCDNDSDGYSDCNDYDCCSLRLDCPSTTACGR